MVEKTKKLIKGSLREEESSTLLQRYTATTVLALLQEVAHCPDVKIDWNALVKNTSTGISDAREYQMLWRHLAYRHALLGKLEYGAYPLDDDSDLEYEVEAIPSVSSDASIEAAACVKVLIASGLPSECSLPAGSIVEAPLTINIPNGWSSTPSENSEATCSMQGTNITIPVSLQKMPLPAATPAEGLDANGSASSMPRRKRKPWSEAEDMELIAAVQKCGEGNWANIVRGDFKGDRTASQLSQEILIGSRSKRLPAADILYSRKLQKLGEVEGHLWHAWAEILGLKSKEDTFLKSMDDGLGLLLGLKAESAPVLQTKYEGPSFVQPANNGLDRGPMNRPVVQKTRSKIGLSISSSAKKRWAIIRKRRDNLNVEPNSIRSQLSEERRAAHHAMSLALDMPIRNLPVARPAGINTTSNSVLPPPIALPSSVLQVEDQPHKCSNATKSSAIGSLGSISKSHSSIKPSRKPTLGSDSALRATAVAAGARIASPSDAASFIKATQAKTAVHLKPADGSPTKLSIPGGVSTQSDTQANVRNVCTGLEANPCSSYHAGNVTNSALHTGSVKVVLPTVQHASSSFAIQSNLSSSEQANAVSSTLPSEVLPKQEVMTAEKIKVSKSGYAPKEEVHDGACAS